MSMFSRRHYEWLARQQRELIRATTDAAELRVLIAANKNLSDALQDENPGFNGLRFIKACMPPEMFGKPAGEAKKTAHENR